MPGAGELAHVGADLGDQHLGGGRAHARHLLQPLDGVAKGRQRGLDPRIESGDRRLQLLDRLQMLGQQETVMLPDMAVETS